MTSKFRFYIAGVYSSGQNGGAFNVYGVPCVDNASTGEVNENVKKMKLAKTY
jgi:hypothetical protein